MSDVPNDDLRSAGISPRERLERIEEMLSRIDGKLDGKADAAALIALEGRIRDLETHGSTHAVEAAEAARRAVAQVEELKRRLAYYTGAIAFAVFAVNVGLAKGWL